MSLRGHRREVPSADLQKRDHSCHPSAVKCGPKGTQRYPQATILLLTGEASNQKTGREEKRKWNDKRKRVENREGPLGFPGFVKPVFTKDSKPLGSPLGGATAYQLMHRSINRQVANMVAKNGAYLALSRTFRYVFIESPL
ncbi:hypothetical protein TNCV_4269281 [Trichonephila clavipes]|nr:hypothetical protein TNCV_4269281 [Trichonephila clavipes]